MNEDHISRPADAKRPWTTPRLEHLGDMADVRGNGAQPPNDASFSPSVAAS